MSARAAITLLHSQPPTNVEVIPGDAPRQSSLFPEQGYRVQAGLMLKSAVVVLR